MNLRKPVLLFLFIFPVIAYAASPVPIAIGSRPPSPVSYEYKISVTDERGEPLPGVSVFTDDLKKVATSTDENGKAMLKDVPSREEINFTFVGYEPLKMPFFEIKQRNGIVKMSPEVREIKEVVVIGRRDDTPDKVPYILTKVDKETIALSESQTTADALEKQGGVFVQKSQMGGGSPILRGFEANRVLLVVDGVRLNNAIYRSGHLQNAITMDNAMLERIEVTMGPGSLIYGSDALGGVVHFRSKDPKLCLDKTPNAYRMEGGAYARFASANSEKSIHADLNYGKRKWASLSSFTFTDYGDLRAGSKRPEGYDQFGRRLYFVRRVGKEDQIIENVTRNADSTYSDNSNLQIGTAYSQMDFLQKIKFQPSLQTYHIVNFQFSTSSDVPRYDNLSEYTGNNPRNLRFAEWYYGPQKRLLASVKSRFSKPSFLYDKASYIASFQRIDEDRINRRLERSQRTFNLEDVWVGSFTADFDKSLDSAGQHQVMFGADFNYNRVRSTAGKVKLSDEGLDDKVVSRYPKGGNETTSAAAYATYRWSTRDSILSYYAGLRYTRATLYSKFVQDSIIIWPDFYLDPGVRSKHGDLTWASGITVNARSGIQVRALGSKAFRSPNLDDYSQIRVQNGFITIPNPDLKPEKTYNAELALSKQFGAIRQGKGLAFSLGGSAYYTWLKDAIVRRNYPLPDGSNILIMDGDSLETQAKLNAETGFIFGWSAEAGLQIGSRFELTSDLNFTKGRTEFSSFDDNGQAIDTLVPAAHIPPMFGKTSLTFIHKKGKINFAVHYQSKKPAAEYGVADAYFDEHGNLVLDRAGTEDNLELSWFLTDDEGNRELVGMLAWTTFNLYTSWKIGKRHTVNLAVENITDRHYRTFSSGVSAGGRNFIVSLRSTFGK